MSKSIDWINGEIDDVILKVYDILEEVAGRYVTIGNRNLHAAWSLRLMKQVLDVVWNYCAMKQFYDSSERLKFPEDGTVAMKIMVFQEACERHGIKKVEDEIMSAWGEDTG